jgi:hypothetical protein
MRDDLHSDGRDDGRKRDRSGLSQRPMADREVPIGPRSSTIPAAVHAWLDGESTEREARRAGWSRDVDFWRRLDDDLASRRGMTTPRNLGAQIMSAIPTRLPQSIDPWWRRDLVVTPQHVLVAVVALVAIAVLATALLLR